MVCLGSQRDGEVDTVKFTEGFVGDLAVDIFYLNKRVRGRTSYIESTHTSVWKKKKKQFAC